MNNLMKAVLVVCATALLVTAAMIYFSPYQSCVRSYGNAKIGAFECQK